MPGYRVMREGWTRVAFGEVVRLSRARTSDALAEGLDRYVGLEHLEPGELKVRRWGNVADGTTFTTIFRPGQVLFGKRRAYQRKLAVANFSGVCSGDIYVLEPRDERLRQDVLPFICRTESFVAHAINTSAGSLSPRTSWDALEQLEIDLPPPKVQQQLAETFWGIHSAVEALANARDRVRAVVDALVLQSSQTHFVALGSVARSVEYGCSLPSRSDGTGVPILRIPDIVAESANLTGLARLDVPPQTVAKSLLADGDILMVRTNGNPDYVGRCARISGLTEPTAFASYLIRIKVDEAKLRPAYAALALSTRRARAQLRTRARSSAGNFNINSQEIRSLQIPLPPVEVQDRTVEVVTRLDQARRHISERAGELVLMEHRAWARTDW